VLLWGSIFSTAAETNHLRRDRMRRGHDEERASGGVWAIARNAARARRTFSTMVVMVGAISLLMAAGAGAAVAKVAPGSTPSAPVIRGSRYLALGDSVAFGYEEPSVVPAPNYMDAASFHGYPEQLGTELHLKVANAACPGETTSSFIDVKAISNGCENTLGTKAASYRAHFPLHVSYKGSQLAFALSYLRAHPRTRLVSLMAGANDYFVCAETTKDGCTSASERQRVLSRISHNIHVILSDIRNQAHYHGQLVIVNYYSLNYASALSNAQSLVLDRTLDAAAKPFGAKFADGFDEFKIAAEHSGGSACTAGLLTQLGNPGKCGVHPSYAGQALLAEAVETVIRI
jgi:lysophospholipase L1-like esterase